MKCYFLSWKNKGKIGYVAYSKIKVGPSYEVIKTVVDASVLYFDLTIKEVIETKKGLIVNDSFDTSADIWLDYIPNSLAWPLMSEKLKNIIDNNITGEEGISWISANVECGSESKKYYILKFTKKPDVLNLDKTLFVAGTDSIIKPVFAQDKILNLAIFSKPAYADHWKIPHGLYVSEHLKKAMQKEKLTGLEFSQAKVE